MFHKVSSKMYSNYSRVFILFFGETLPSTPSCVTHYGLPIYYNHAHGLSYYNFQSDTIWKQITREYIYAI